MGYTQSKIKKNEGKAVYRCQDRKQFMSEAVTYRNALAAAHSAYAICLKNTGAALSDYTQGEFSHHPSSNEDAAAAAVVQSVSGSSSSIKILPPPPPPPPPPPLPNFHAPAARTPVIESKTESKSVTTPVPMPPAVEKKGMKNRGGGIERRQFKPVSLMQLFSDLDDHFLKASESAREVSQMLVAEKLHYHSNFADNRGHIDLPKRAMRASTWNLSIKRMPIIYDGEDNYDMDEDETHATLLDKMLAWEKKLYDEMKAGDTMKHEYQKKFALLNEQMTRGSNPESLERLKSAVSRLQARYIIDKESMDLTVAEINRLRDEQLYPNFVRLVDGMATMWETMHYHQSKIVCALKSLDNEEVVRGASECRCVRTTQLCEVVSDWHTQFCRLLDYQKEYIRVLNRWLKLNLVPFKSISKEKVSPPPRVQDPPIRAFLIAWNDGLENFPDEISRSAMSKFSAMMQSIVLNQDEEIKMRGKCDATQKELERKCIQYEEWCMKNGVNKEIDAGNTLKIAMEERECVVVSLRQQLAEDEEECRKICRQVRKKYLAGQTDLFRAMSEMALACSAMYSGLRSIAEDQYPSPNT